MTSIDSSQVTGEPFQKALGQAQPDIADMVGIARRGWYFIIAGIAFGLLGAYAVLHSLPTTYKASSRIAFERTQSRYLHSNKVTNEPLIEDSDTWGQIYVISSESIVLSVVKALSLTTDPEFVGGSGTDSLGSRIRGLVLIAEHAIGLGVRRPEVLSKQALENVALEGVLRNLSVSREDTPSVINVAFSSKDPAKASMIVNAIVDTYLKAGIAGKAESTVVARKVMQERVEELKQQVKDADLALFEYKAANGILGLENMTLSHGQYNLLNIERSKVAFEMSEAKARMERMASDPNASSTEVPDNDGIKKLRGELLDLSIRASDLEKLVGKDHLAAVKIRNRMEILRQAIANEQRRIAGSAEKDYERAQDRYNIISAQSTQLANSNENKSDQQARVIELSGTADTLRRMYNRMLEQLGEMNKVEAQPSIPDVVVLMRAAPPTQTEASKKRWLILAGGSFMGLLLGGSVVLARNFPFGVFRTSQQVTHATGLFCAVLPAIGSAEEQASLQTGEYALNAPYSRFAETLRNIWALSNIAQQKSGAKVVCVISSVPGEGKTIVATNLAALVRHSGTRVLVIDADFHRRSLTENIASDAQVGLKEALVQPKALSKYVIRNERLNLDVLPCPVLDRIPNAAELLGTTEMEQLVDTAREAYDLVIIDAPPMAAVVDYKMIARHCDSFVVVVEWGKTSQRVVFECLNDASALLDRIVCVVLNKVDPSALRSIEQYKGDRFLDYYSDRKRA
jgi:succinoglycan biosynthesis transport protein ExoP